MRKGLRIAGWATILWIGAAACSKPASLAGTISIAPALADQLAPTAVLYIMARRTMGPPLAVQRVAHPKFPLPYTLSQADVMMPGQAFEGPLYVVARVDMDGDAHPPAKGDLEGMCPTNPVPLGSRKADILIDKRY